METRQTSTKDRILHAAYQLFYREGFTRVSVDAIAAQAEVTKRTVYYHFQSKDDVVAEVLGRQHQYVLQRFQEWAEPDTKQPNETVEKLFLRLQEWADGDHWLGSGFTRIGTELADRPGHPARKAASLHKKMLERWLVDQLETGGLAEPEPLARHIMVLIEGSMSLSLIHGDTEYIRSAGIAAADLLSNTKRPSRA